MGVNLRPKTPAPMMRIEDIGAGLLFVEGEGAAMLRLREVWDIGREEERNEIWLWAHTVIHV